MRRSPAFHRHFWRTRMRMPRCQRAIPKTTVRTGPENTKTPSPKWPRPFTRAIPRTTARTGPANTIIVNCRPIRSSTVTTEPFPFPTTIVIDCNPPTVYSTPCTRYAKHFNNKNAIFVFYLSGYSCCVYYQNITVIHLNLYGCKM